ncbi:hypothetical protein I4U23_022653 [Adineta vaga]|nr:hypothetical protein I4U23_022653 [Adineta vaga]
MDILSTNETVTSVYATGQSTIKCPKDAIDILFKKSNHHLRSKVKHELLKHEVTQEEIDSAAKYGRFSQRPSDLFLKLFHCVIRTLEYEPLSGCVSPKLIGTSGVIPLTIISTIPDIMQHYHHVIVHAQKEVLFATCWWLKGDTAIMIGNALRDLSKRAAQEKRQVIVKLMIDHFTKRNLIHSHNILPSSEWTHCNIPSAEELPFITMEVNTYHRIILGAFHSKFLIVDRKIALLNSNNIYDRPNLEMMVHYEGDIVNSFYDTYLITWQLPLQPNLVCLQEEASNDQEFDFGIDSAVGSSVKGSLKRAVANARFRLRRYYSIDENEMNLNKSPETFPNIVSKVLLKKKNSYSPNVLVKTTTEIAGNVIHIATSPRLQHPLTTHLNGTSPIAQRTKTAENLTQQQLQSLSVDFSPFVFHTPHEPIPIALVNRESHGRPGHGDIINPQNAAWLGAFRYAQRSIFIQSPMFNATLAIDGVISACRRGIKVILWLDLGYDALKEGFGTFQGGTNDHVVKKIYKQLKGDGQGTEKNLEAFWYTAKDQIRPFNFSQKQRNCHIKFMSIDEQVAIMGSGNMDTQTWCHSQEMNTMIDSPLIVKELIDALYKNQSTNKYGRVGEDGQWHDI